MLLLSDLIIFAVVLSLCLVVASILGSFILMNVLFSETGLKWYTAKIKKMQDVMMKDLFEEVESNEEE